MQKEKILLVYCFIFFGVSGFSQVFEGSIYFTKSNLSNVVRYVYHVKGNQVRIDEISEKSEVPVAALLVNLETEEMIALSHKRNLYLSRPSSKKDEIKLETNFTKGNLNRVIHNRECVQFRVKNKAANREIMYWTTQGNFSFFPKLLRILNRKDNFSTYYLTLPDLNNKLPLMAKEYTSLRELKGFLQIDKIEEKELDISTFRIPEGFAKIER